MKFPELSTVSVAVCPSVTIKNVWGPEADISNCAVTAWSASNVTRQDPVPVHAPDQPVKVEPAAGTAVRVTTVSAS